ncbi:hypothetical protein F2Q70_00012268 [Brassica cretica]|uniref:Uncharacterized protein n=1 Tax=Brassica cretica TaxID=69181 RepID=A0A8S9MBC9_BRACR|nr:hypothetical protein F2Q70_00012268 [Brassica cretica]
MWPREHGALDKSLGLEAGGRTQTRRQGTRPRGRNPEPGGRNPEPGGRNLEAEGCFVSPSLVFAWISSVY